MKQKATIKDVAKELGISVSTVSRVMNGLDRVSPAMRKKVLDTARRLNYVPSLAAVSVVRRQTKLLAALLPDLTTPLYASILEAFEEAARIRGYHTLTVLSHGSHEEEMRFLNSMVGRSVDGLAIIPSSPALSDYTAPQSPSCSSTARAMVTGRTASWLTISAAHTLPPSI